MTAVSFTVVGVAAPAGSKRALRNPHTGRVQVVDASRRAPEWKALVAAAAAQAMCGAEPLRGPLHLRVVVHAARPASHRDRHGTVRRGAPQHPAVRPDITKLVRAVEDAMTGIVYVDDAQIVEQHAAKRYTLAAPMVQITVSELL